ncbi:MAG: diacylglycerol kinase family lipid kinase [Eggerthellaceae bacterium]|nr:diacylglycerol kinase family lipid kinase [Eggerthellaceae bacterium]
MLIANPVAQNGRGKDVAGTAISLLRSAFPEDEVDFELTQHRGHGTYLAQKAADYDLVIALGGDGIVHEVVNGLMRIDRPDRPDFALLPLGSGNDYAQTLGSDTTSIEKAVFQLKTATVIPVDVGTCNGQWFAETISFGLDAAIALDTISRRTLTGKTGTSLYLSAGLDQLMHNMVKHAYDVSFDDGPWERSTCYLFSVQNGPTYGGGFRAAPAASVVDGALDVMIAHAPLSRLAAIRIFLSAKNGNHTHFKALEFRRVKSLKLRFYTALPIQIDGEEFKGTKFDIGVERQALDVLCPADRLQSVFEGDLPWPDYLKNRDADNLPDNGNQPAACDSPGAT